MVARNGGMRAACQGKFLCVAAVVAATLVSLSWLVNASWRCKLAGAARTSAPAGSSASATVNTAKQAIDESGQKALLARYQAVLRNVTTRVKTAEHALQRLQRLHAVQQAAQVASAVREGPPPGAAPMPRAAPAPAPAPEEEEETEPSDAEVEKQQEVAEQEQAQQILFDSATGKFGRRWRPDFKCGSRVPLLPDGENVECNPESEAPCCSAIGWCGREKDHCRCPLCVNYAEKKAAAGLAKDAKNGLPDMGQGMSQAGGS
mmetsp:Transcript_152961/g.292950  ORF Transcript_152961/g.292950 Transcript_152961/m.292950 type:complete len:261 (+) Transcript_152961:72-854(+)